MKQQDVCIQPPSPQATQDAFAHPSTHPPIHTGSNQPTNIMAILNPVYVLIVPFLFVVTIPLAIFAGITTTLAFSVLMFRVAVVYIDIAVHMVPQYVTGLRFSPLSRYPNAIMAGTTSPSLNRPVSPAGSSSGHSTPPLTIATNRVIIPVRHHRRRRTSGASFNSVGSITPIDDNVNGPYGGNKRDSFAMVSSLNMDRDFEGVGGWRLGGKHADYDDAWAQLNSRLELPLDTQRRHHHRSPSGGGATTPGGAGEYLVMKSPRAMRSVDTSPNRRGRERKERDGGVKVVSMVSPNSSRQRTPTNTAPPPFTTIDSADGSYFPPISSPQSARRVY